MAVIGKIRERSGLLLVIVGGAMAAFILTDLFSGRGGGRQDAVLGEVGGEEISVMDFEKRVSDEVESYRNDFGQQVNAQMQEQVRTSVWNEVVKERVMLDQVMDAGFTLTEEEYNDIRFGNNILPDFRNQPNFQGAECSGQCAGISRDPEASDHPEPVVCQVQHLGEEERVCEQCPGKG